MENKFLNTNYKQDNMFILFIDTIVLSIFNCPKGSDLYPKIAQFFKTQQDDDYKIFGDKYEFYSIDIKLCDTIDNDVWSLSFPVKFRYENGETITQTYELRRYEGSVL